MNEKELSEFGEGFISCLVNFAGHFMNEIFENETEEQKKKSIEIYHGEENYISHKIEIWANGATDHLYEIVAPEGKQWNAIREKVNLLKDRGLEMGHGYTDKVWKPKDKQFLMDLTRKIAVETDKILGIESDSGQWQ